MGSLDGLFDGSNYVKNYIIFLGKSLEYTDDEVLGLDKGIKLRYSHGKVLGTILVNVDIMSLGIDVGTEMVSLDGSFDASKDGKLERLLIVDSMEYTYDKMIPSDEGIKFAISCGKVIGTILGRIYVIIVGMDVVTELVSLYGYPDCFN